MGFTKVLLLTLSTFFFVMACQSSPESVGTNSSRWNSQMQVLAANVTDLLPFMFNKREFSDPSNRTLIESKIKVLSTSAHNIPLASGEKRFGNDPLLKFAVKNLKGNMEKAYSSFQSGHLDYSRHILVSSMGICFQCHTTSAKGPSYTDWKLSFNNLSLSSIEKVRIYIATRQYDLAIELLEKNLDSSMRYKNDPLGQEQVLKTYLALMVRVKNDPQKALKTVRSYLDHNSIPLYLRESAVEWKKSLQDWVTHKKSSGDSLQAAKDLVQKAQKLRKYRSLDSANIEYLRASSLLHQELAKPITVSQRAQIYFLLGRSYDVLSNNGFWELPEAYYEACIRELPATQLAKNCFKNYEKNIVLGFSGSAGIFLPKSERDKMSQLKKMAGFPSKQIKLKTM